MKLHALRKTGIYINLKYVLPFLLVILMCQSCKHFLPISVGTIVVGGVKLKFWDLGGQEELQSLWDKVSIQYTTCIHDIA